MLSWKGKDQSCRWLAVSVVLMLIGIGLITVGLRSSRRAERDAAGVALMPMELRVSQVRDLEPGQSGWVTSWSIVVTQGGACWLDRSASVEPKRYGTANVYVTRTREGFYHARSHARRYRWDVTSDFSADRFYPIVSFTY